MTLRGLGRLAVGGFMFFAVLSIGLLVLRVGADRGEGGVPDEIKDARRSIVYRLAPDRWIDFPVTQEGERVRLLMHADLPPDLPEPEVTRLEYSVRMQVLSATGEVLEERLFAEPTRMIRYRDPDSGAIFNRSLYLGRNGVPGSIRSQIVALPQGKRADTVRLRLERADAAIGAVWVRYYELERTAQHKLGYLWDRMSEDARAMLALGNIYPPQLLTVAEKRNVLAARWRPLGPRGVEDRDYEQETLYVQIARPGVRLRPGVPPDGLMVDRDLAGVIAVPEPGGRLRIAATALQPAPVKAEALWLGRELWQRQQRAFAWKEAGAPEVWDVGPGRIEIKVDGPAVLRAFLTPEGSDQEQEITPVPPAVTAFTARPGEPVAYRVRHVGGVATPFRLDLRCVCADLLEFEGGEVALDVVLLDDRGGEVARHKLLHQALPGTEERMVDPERVAVSMGQSFYFLLPPGVDRLVVEPSQPILVSAFNRPYGLPRQLTVPRDYTIVGLDQRLPAWFYLRPLDAVDLRAQGRFSVVEIRRLRDDDLSKAITAGNYRFDDFLPAGDWLGRHLFEARDRDAPTRRLAAASVYRRLALGRSHQVTIVRTGPGQRVSPGLLVEAPGPGRLTVVVDGTEVLSRPLRAGVREIDIADLAAGEHSLRIDAPSGSRVWMSGLAEGQGEDARLKRLAIRVGRQPVVIPVEKASAGEETLSISYFADDPRFSGGQVNASLDVSSDDAIGPFSDLTIPVWRFLLEEPTGDRAIIVGSQRTQSAPGQRFFLQLGDDLPPGVVRLRLGFPADGFAVIARLLPNRAEEGRFETEVLEGRQ